MCVCHFQVEFRKESGVARATATYTGELRVDPHQRMLFGQWRGRGIRGTFALWQPRRFQVCLCVCLADCQISECCSPTSSTMVQEVRSAVRLLVNLGHTFADVAQKSVVLGASSFESINRLVADRKERGERFPELDEIIRDIS